MEYFLKAERRQELQQELQDLTMPEVYARITVNEQFPENDIAVIDRYMTRRAQIIVEWAQQLADAAVAKDDENMKMFAMYMVADMLLMDAYTEECKERGVFNQDNLPLFMKECLDGISKTQAIKKYALENINKEPDTPTRH